jgi:flagellar assembly protein FliH
MSSRLIAAGEAAVCEPMPWSKSGSGTPRTSPQPLFRGDAPRLPETPQEDLQAKIATLEQRIEQARSAGRAEGEAQARQSGHAELQAVLQKLAASIYEAGELRARLRGQAESDLVRLAIAIARKVIGREVNTDPETIAGVVKASLERLRIQEVLRVRLHPDHKAIVVDYLARLGASHVEVHGRPALGRGAVVFETTRGNLDASVETQLREIERGLTDRFRGRAV